MQIRTVSQFIFVIILGLIIVYFLDSRFRVLPTSIHNHLPTHHPGIVLTDLTVTTCSKLTIFAGCKLDPNTWQRVEKDLYLGRDWFSTAYVHIQGKKEEELLPEDKVIIDITTGRLDPSFAIKDGDEGTEWERRPMGVWLKRSSQRHVSDSSQAITAVDVLFGADAVDPRIGWRLVGTTMLLNTRGELQEAKLTIRRGYLIDMPKPIPKINEHGRFKIMQVADLHLSTGTGLCRDAQPPETALGCEADPRTLEFTEKLLDTEKPDLVVLSGDQINGETSPDAQSVCT